jgi:hypothetical protein
MAEVYYREFPEFAPTSRMSHSRIRKRLCKCSSFSIPEFLEIGRRMQSISLRMLTFVPYKTRFMACSPKHSISRGFAHGDTILSWQYNSAPRIFEEHGVEYMFNCLLNRSQIYPAKPRWRTCHQWYLGPAMWRTDWHCLRYTSDLSRG